MKDGDCRDRISELPDHILHHVLSFLPSATDVVGTSIISKRWRNLWASVPSLCFSDDYFDDPKGFKRFVDSFLIFRKTLAVHAFSFDLKKDLNDWNRHISRWIRYSVMNDVKDLQITVNLDSEVEIPDCIFTSQSLQTFALINCNFEQIPHLEAPKHISLIQLNKLYLEYIIINDGSMERIITLCPLLQDLDLNICDFKTLEISSPTLVKLTMEGCDGEELRISCPNLTSLDITEGHISNVVLDSLSSLESGIVHTYDDLDEISYGALSSAKSLDLIVDIQYDYQREKDEDSEPMDLSLSCPLALLKTIQIKGFRKHLAATLKFVEFLLENAKSVTKCELIS